MACLSLFPTILAAQAQHETASYDGVLVERGVLLPDFTSASGMSLIGKDRWLAVGDDGNHLGVLDGSGNLLALHLITDAQPLDENGRVPKLTKRDFESIASYDDHGIMRFVVMGSGTKVPARTFVLLGAYVDGLLQTQELQAAEFYTQLMQAADISPDSLNIEGATVVGQTLILLNREDNKLLGIPLQAAIDAMRLPQRNQRLEVDVVRLRLPEFAGIVAGLSGACSDSTGTRVYFSASVEDNTDPLMDGQILGSYVGWIDWRWGMKEATPTTYHLVDAEGNRSFDKLESVEILGQTEDGLRLAGVTDNDDGSSQWLQILVPNKYLPTQLLPQGSKKD